jgi:hypothetical protein
MKKVKDDSLKFDDHDMTFCLNAKCDKTDCERNYSHTERGVIYSFARWEIIDGKCDGYRGDKK